MFSNTAWVTFEQQSETETQKSRRYWKLPREQSGIVGTRGNFHLRGNSLSVFFTVLLESKPASSVAKCLSADFSVAHVVKTRMILN